MARSFFIPGESMVYVKGNTNSLISSLSELGLSDDQITCTPQFKHAPIEVNAWGEVPPEIQFMLSSVNISMTLVNFDNTLLQECLRLSMAGAAAAGTLPRAGSLMGNGLARFVYNASTGLGNNFIGLNIAAPVSGFPWCFLYAYLTGPPAVFPMGVERQIVTLNWEAIPYNVDLWNGGLGAKGQVLWQHTLDS